MYDVKCFVDFSRIYAYIHIIRKPEAYASCFSFHHLFVKASSASARTEAPEWVNNLHMLCICTNNILYRCFCDAYNFGITFILHGKNGNFEVFTASSSKICVCTSVVMYSSL